MNNGPSEEIEIEEHIWDHGKSASQLSSSENSMSAERKEIIRQALDFDIIDIRTYTGYKGDLLVEITTMDPEVTQALKKIAESLGMEGVIAKSIIAINKIYCIAPSLNTYDLKD